MKFCENIRILSENQTLIISNSDNGAWIKMSEEVYRVIERYIYDNNRDVCFDDFFCDYVNEDREYIAKVLKLMEKIGIIDYTVERKLTRADFAITSLCNLKCKHCSNSLMEGVYEPQFQEIVTALYQLSKIGITQVCITGGEPLMRDDFNNIVSVASDLFDSLALMTNGTLIESKNVRFLCEKFDSISISIDGYDSDSCEKIRGKGVFEKVIETVKLLHDYRCKQIALSAIDNKYNDSMAFYDLCKSLGVKAAIRKYAPSGRGFKNEKELFLPIFDKMSREKKILADYIYEKGINYGFSENATTVCSAYKESIYIDSDLKIYPCGALNLPEFQGDSICEISDIRKYFDEKEYRNTEGYRNYESIKPENAIYCEGCSVCIFCNDCPAYVYLYHKNGYLDLYCEKCKDYMKGKIYEIN